MDGRRRSDFNSPRSDPSRPPFAPSDARTAGRAAADEASADEARRRLHARGIVPIEPDERIGVMLGPDELVVAVRPSVMLERRQRCRDDAPGLGGDLYVTNRRLVHLGRSLVAYPLDEVREAVVAPDRLLLVVGDSLGVVLSVDDPRLLRVEIAAARAAARAEEREARWACEGAPAQSSVGLPERAETGDIGPGTPAPPGGQTSSR